ncbi:unnamed protein product [Symbiodinium natans]|uniref:Uncharacterized protein n=1 Tax=Symbiodinium natans TaxID=878477 RepID=A0A812I371_9DINO|nr:unnamed protein product [Symbiodinium natans]
MAIWGGYTFVLGFLIVFRNNQVMDLGGMCEQSGLPAITCSLRCEVISQWIYRLIVQKAREEVVGNPKIKVLDVPPPILGRPLADLASALADVYRARKIAEIPFPFPYAQMILDMLLVFSIVTPVLASQLVSSTAMAALATFCVTAGYWALFHIADEIDQPFGMDPNDLKLNNMQRDFNETWHDLALWGWELKVCLASFSHALSGNVASHVQQSGMESKAMTPAVAASMVLLFWSGFGAELAEPCIGRLSITSFEGFNMKPSRCLV